jgi:Ca2+/Na+ antiporter
MHELPWYWLLLGGMLGSAIMLVLVVVGLSWLLWGVSSRIARVDDREERDHA